MGSYGYNFDFAVPPEARNRRGQHFIDPDGDDIVIGAPIEIDTAADPDSVGRRKVVLAVDGGTGEPANVLHGVLVYEFIEYRGDDPVITTYSMKGQAPAGAAVQLVSDPDIIIRFHNTEARTFLGSRRLPARTMVAGMGATPTIDIGSFLAPGDGNDEDGYWAAVEDFADAWLTVVDINLDRAEVYARMLF